ncbi:MAG: hypothetical protein B6U97_04460 [Candidatus Altiarchaeales archaeon ex4484_96]|nr:MAG: hypothetical protein B6U97_04460 [Candidatus Altiarchaeales archaeon ex4484_96]
MFMKYIEFFLFTGILILALGCINSEKTEDTEGLADGNDALDSGADANHSQGWDTMTPIT